jgi:beta-1,4-mannosyltransferase
VNQAEARTKLGISPDSFVYLFFGMVRPYKGIEELLDAFSRLGDPSATLLVVGSCPDAALVETINEAAQHDRRISPVLRYVGNEEIQYFMRAANVVVLPFSDIFTSGSAVLAMGFGRALLVPRIGCLPSYVDSRGGLLYEPGDNRLHEAMRLVAAADLRSMGRHNRSVAERLDWRAIAQRKVEIYGVKAFEAPEMQEPAALEPPPMTSIASGSTRTDDVPDGLGVR